MREAFCCRPCRRQLSGILKQPRARGMLAAICSTTEIPGSLWPREAAVTYTGAQDQLCQGLSLKQLRIRRVQKWRKVIPVLEAQQRPPPRFSSVR